MPLLKTVTTPSGKRPLGWVVQTSDLGNILVVRRMPAKMAVTTKRSKYVSLNESAAQDEAGWALDEPLTAAMRRYDCKKVAVFVPKPGVLYMTDADNYYRSGVVYMVAKNKSSDRIRCVGMEHFERRTYRAKV